MQVELTEQETELLIKGLHALKQSNIAIVVAMAKSGDKLTDNERLNEINGDMINASCLLDKLMFGKG